MFYRETETRLTLSLALSIALWLPPALAPTAAQAQQQEQEQTQEQAEPESTEAAAAAVRSTESEESELLAEDDGCACLWQGSFVDVQHTTDLVVAGTVVARRGNSVDLSVERELRGEAHREQIRIWLKARDYCRPDAAEFDPDSRWVMALTQIREVPADGFDQSTPNISYGRPWDYVLSSCGGYWLSLGDKVVTGNLIDAPRWAREPKMTPVLLDLLAAYVRGEVDQDAIRAASREDPALREMLLDTKAFLRESREH